MKWRVRLKERSYLKQQSKATPGTADWLIGIEIKYGGKSWVVSVENNSIDSEGSSYMATGGDRMLHHGYARYYEKFLHPYVQNRDHPIVFCEVGVLAGTGLAIWCDLFPYARCIGLDVDLSNIERNMENLLNLGAFSENSPELFEYDQFVESSEYLKEILGGDTIDIFTDDGNHSDEAIMTTLKSVAPHLSEQFVYFVEDNWEVHKQIKSEYPEWTVYSDCELTVVTPSTTAMGM